MQHTWDVIVAGGGPAGLSAALMLGRSRRRTLVIDAGSPRNRFAAHMHGVLGQEGVAPGDLLSHGRTEAEAYGIEFLDAGIDRVEDEPGGVRITTADGTALSARALIVATGISDELPAIPGLAERWGTTVLHCPYCHGWEVRDQRLGVLTTSPLSMHQAELLRQWSDRLTVFTAGLGGLSPEAERRLRSRGVALVPEPVVEVVGEGTSIDVVRVEGGGEIAVDAIFTAGAPRPHDDFLAPLDLARTELPFGSFLEVDFAGRTSHERVWAVGNVVSPMANVPLSIGAGSMTGGAVNGALVAWDFDAATNDPVPRPRVAPAEFWEDRYASADRVWSGEANRLLADVASALVPGRALDLGCGEGGDVIWLARHGWTATGIDISPTAIRRAAAAAESAGVDRGSARFVVGDLASLPDGMYDLVTASFLQSPVELPRADILRNAATLVASGGHLLITSHAGFPPGSEPSHDHEPRFLDAAEELDQLALDHGAWDVVIAETRTREGTLPDGRAVVLDDTVVLVRRR